jgi:hypothetical protein
MFSIPVRWIPSFIVATIVLLAACAPLTGSGNAQEEAHTPPPEGTATPPPALPTASSPPPTSPPPTTNPLPTDLPSALQPLVGSEWQVVFDGDLNHDMQRDVVAYKPADIAPAASMSTYTQELPLTVAEAVIVQEEPDGEPIVQAAASPQGVYAREVALIPGEQFGDPGPSAFLMGVDPQAEIPVSFIPLNANGEAYAQGFGLYWNEGQLAYRLFANGQAVPPPNTPDGSTLPRSTPLPSETQAPDETEIVLYWTVGESLQTETRRIPTTPAIGTAALEALLAGPQHPGLSTAIPTPEEVQTYPGRQNDWGDRVRLLNLTIEDGVATANFSQEMQAYGGGSARVDMIRQQITQTLKQFPTVNEVRIAIEGETEGVLQP